MSRMGEKVENFDAAMCQFEVCTYMSGWPYYHQCMRKHVAGGLYCKQHDPAAIEARRKKSDAEGEAAWNARMIEHGSQEFFAALKKIADGDNNPRETAASAIAPYRKYVSE